MPSPSFINIKTDEVILVDVSDRFTGQPITSGSVVVAFLDGNNNPLPGGTFSLSHQPSMPGRWIAIIPKSFTETLQPNRRYKLAITAISGTGMQQYCEREIEAVVCKAD